MLISINFERVDIISNFYAIGKWIKRIWIQIWKWWWTFSTIKISGFKEQQYTFNSLNPLHSHLICFFLQTKKAIKVLAVVYSGMWEQAMKKSWLRLRRGKIQVSFAIRINMAYVSYLIETAFGSISWWLIGGKTQVIITIRINMTYVSYLIETAFESVSWWLIGRQDSHNSDGEL